MDKNILKNKRGLTLVEIVVSTTLFSIVIYITFAIFQGVVVSQRSTVISQNVQEATRYAFEVMSKEIRMAQKRRAACALTSNRKVYDTNDNTAPYVGSELRFVNTDNLCTTYYLAGGQLFVRRGAENFAITPDDITLTNLNFSVTDDVFGAAAPTTQSRVTISVEASQGGGPNVIGENIRLQTTISSRSYQ